MKRSKHTGARLVLLGIIAVFVLPMVAAYWLFLKSDTLDFETSNVGSFFTPPVDIAAVLPAEQSALEHWWLAFITPETCESQCLAQLEKLRSVQLALGRDSVKLQRLLVAPQAHSALTPQHQQLVSGTVDIDQLAPLLTDVSNEQIVLIDPNGLLVLYYAPTIEGTGILRDVRKLLKTYNG